jgi:hypothetical protein
MRVIEEVSRRTVAVELTPEEAAVTRWYLNYVNSTAERIGPKGGELLIALEKLTLPSV